MSEQLELFAVEKPKERWIESWHNSSLRFADVAPEHHWDWLEETGKWLHAGRRWPLGASDAAHKHCLYWFERVAAMMAAHGWTWEYQESRLGDITLDQITWRLEGQAQKYELSNSSNSAVYAAICGAAIVRRKAKYYGLWKRVTISATKTNQP